MDRIGTESRRMAALVEDLLLLARLDEGRPIRRDPVDLTRIANDAVSDLRAIEPDRPVVGAIDRGVVVPGDDDRLRQVLGNLVANVRVHGGQGRRWRSSFERVKPRPSCAWSTTARASIPSSSPASSTASTVPTRRDPETTGAPVWASPSSPRSSPPMAVGSGTRRRPEEAPHSWCGLASQQVHSTSRRAYSHGAQPVTNPPSPVDAPLTGGIE